MQLKIISLKSIIKTALLGVLVTLVNFGKINAQEIIKDEKPDPKTKTNTVQNSDRVKIDGVAAVVGDFIILDSDIDKEILQLQQRGVSTKDITRCELFGKLLEDKLYAHQAIQDSITVNDAEIRSNIEQQIDAFLAQKNGSMEELLKLYHKDNEQSFRDELFEINKNMMLANKEQQKIIEAVEVTPEEVREFFNKIPKDERPIFGTELKVAQIVVIPKVTEEEKQRAIDKLRRLKRTLLTMERVL